ncbi:hypothetical protein F2Q70_00035838 [Brassica cretica]|uniref:Uncharacterized protein n=1 Tax=Brassica cretica TaxID=69181 RepID=A0A8S9JQF4_BRACR|nr:hypothetical protein F2Q68_00031063 [Brassica cretica]KAF2583707.1 hypothetical protein F2Q70_00035838 [Brassica cretica]
MQAPLEQLRTYNPKSAREDGRLKALDGFWRRDEADRVISDGLIMAAARDLGMRLLLYRYPLGYDGEDLDDSVIKDACRSSLLACVRGVFWRRCVKPTRLMEAAGSFMVRWWLGETALFLWLSGKARDLLTGSRSQHVARSRILGRGQPETRGLGGSTCPNLQDYNALVPDYLESPTVEYAPSVEVVGGDALNSDLMAPTALGVAKMHCCICGKNDVVAETSRQLGSGDVIIIPGDVAEVEDCKEFIDEAIHHFGKQMAGNVKWVRYGLREIASKGRRECMD